MKMYVTSDVTGKTYLTERANFFRNPTQSAHYVSWGGSDVLLDLFVDGNNRFVYVFDKATHDKFKHRWREHCERWNEMEANKTVDNNG